MKTPHSNEQIDKIENLYSDNLRQYGTTSKSVGWKDYKEQLLRFNKLCQVFQNAYKQKDLSISMNDFGCGYGAMFQFVDNLKYVKIDKYYGYDISKTMLKAAAEVIGKYRGVSLIHSDSVLHPADYTFVSGTFNVKFEAHDSEWTKFIISNLDNIAQKSKKGFSFNLLSTYVDWKEDHLFYGDPLYFFNHCKNNYSPYVSLIHDYPLYEWTISVNMDQ